MLVVEVLVRNDTTPLTHLTSGDRNIYVHEFSRKKNCKKCKRIF